ncbi:hypothetical protein KA082_03300, partial [Candidatus Woesebacteria bacterium]|nr:hypothetical protein [Candidatus Woesebacteria bacterium]
MAAADTGAQCGKTAAENSCGTEGGCAYGYRCVLVNGQQRPSCLPDASDATNICPGTPNQIAIKLGCGTPSTNSNTTCD